VDETTFEQTFLEDYGSTLALYLGRGVLTLEDGRNLNCKFEAGQLRGGEVLLLCDIMPPDLSLCFATISAISFEGLTAEGHRIACGNRIMEINYLPDLPRDGRTGVFAAFRLGEMSVHMTEGPIQAKSVRLGVVNFEFAGTDVLQTGNCSRVLPLKLKSGNSTTELFIRPLDNYDKIMRRIKTLKLTDVTCEVVSYLFEEAGDLGYLKEVVADLCHVMSVARGTTIQWIYCDYYDATDECVMRIHSPRITKPFSPSAIIDPRFDGRGETKMFLEQAYGVYVSKRDLWGLNRGVIAAYLDAKAEQDYLEARGAKLAVAMEMLKAVFLELPDSSVKEYVLEEVPFNNLLNPLRDAIDQVLKREGIDTESRKAIGSDGKIHSLNRRSFRYIMNKLCKNIGLEVGEKDLALFVECRNTLVHRGQFYCAAATNGEREKCPPLPSKTHEYFFLVNFLDRIFLKLLGYSGVYIDRRVPGNPGRSQLG